MLLTALGWVRAAARAGRQKYRNMLPFTCSPTAVGRTGPASPSPGASSTAGTFAVLPTILVPPLSRLGSLFFLLVFLDFPPVQPKGRVWALSHVVQPWHTPRDRASGTHS